MTSIASSTPSDDSKSVEDGSEVSYDGDEAIRMALNNLDGKDDTLAQAYRELLEEPVSPDEADDAKSCIRAFKH